jgi:oligopeptide transport system substrate-binding protein
MIRRLFFVGAAVAVLLAGCSDSESDSAVAISVIGPKPRMIDPSRSGFDQPSAALVGALSQGLVSFNASGEVEPALAERWIVTDDGLSYIFRIKRARWSDGRPVTAKEVAQSLRASISPNSRNTLRRHFSAVAEIVAMTDWVIEMRLTTPQPELLPLLAQPEMAILRSGKGTGPYRLHRAFPNSYVLRPSLPEGQSESDVDLNILRKSERRLRGEKASSALARYQQEEVALVLGGSFDTVAYVKAAGIARNHFRRDLAAGLFGLVVTPTSDALGNQDVRQALAMAIDRQRLVGRFKVNGWRPQETLLPAPIASSGNQAAPEWAALTMSARLERARSIIAAGRNAPMRVRVALPDGPGGRVLFAQLAGDWSRIGVEAVRVKMTDVSDLRLIDLVAPQNAAAWYLRQFVCSPITMCTAPTDEILKRIQDPDSGVRANALLEADAAITKDQYFIPLATPMRWSIVAARLSGYQENVYAIHPLNRLGRRGR